MLDIQKTEDGCSIIGDSDILEIIRNHPYTGMKRSYPDVVHHHLVQTRRAEGALDNIGNSLRGQHYTRIS